MENLDGKDVPSPAEVRELLAGIEGRFGRLADADMTTLSVPEQFEVLRTLEKVDALRAVVRGQTTAAFENMSGPDEFGFGAVTSCVEAHLKIAKGKARSYKTWAKRCRKHPLIIDAMKGGLVSESWAEQLMSWSDALRDPELTAKMDDILLAGALAGLELSDLQGLYEEVRALTAPPDGDGKEPRDRGVDLVTTLDGSGVLRGDLTPEATALLKAGLDAYAKHTAGADDDRTYSERAHDALVQLLKIALRSGDVPQSNGQDTTAMVHLPLHELRQMDGASPIEDAWGREMYASWRGQMAAAHAKGGTETWLYGNDARAVSCDAMLAPVVTGQLQTEVFVQIIETGAELQQLTRLEREHAGGQLTLTGLEEGGARDSRILELFLKLTGLVADSVSGPGGLASALRTGLFAGTALGKTSLPLDLGDTDKVKPQLRRALNMLYPVCARTGCSQPASRCEAHHVIPRALHGPTSLKNCANLCWYHHHIAVHKLGWAITANNAGIVIVRRPDGSIENPAHAP